MKRQSKFNKVISIIGQFLVVAIVAYGFLSLMNWSYQIGEWNSFSRFIMGVIGVAFIIKIFDDIF